MSAHAMNIVDNDRASSTLVLGLGKTGHSVIAHLAARGERITAADSRDLAPYLARVRADYPQVELITGRLPLDSLGQYDRIVVSPGVALPDDALAACAQPVIGDIELFAHAARAPIIAITGSNGKSTVTMLAARMIEAAGKRALTGGNIGTPALELLTQPVPDFYVLEVSSFQLERTHSLRAAASAILNISADHLDRHGCIEHYIAAKARILNGARAHVLNRQDRASEQLLRADADAITFGLDRPPVTSDGARHYGIIDTARGRCLCRGADALAPTARMTMPGAHNLANALAALALVEAVGIAPMSTVLDAALDYRGLAHRCELVAQIDGVKWINDSKGTNVGAAVAAIEGLSDGRDDLIWIGGGLGKDADFAPLATALRARVCCAVLFGADAARIETAIENEFAQDDIEIIRARDLAHAVSRANERARASAGQTVLFSPACASFDQFDDYEQRGVAFKRLVAALQETEAKS